MSPPLVHLVKPARKMAVLATEEVRQLFAEQPELTVRGIPYRLLEHGQYETALLQRLGYPVPSPMRTYYDYPAPSDEPAFETQKVTTDLLTLNERAYVLNDMGCVDADTEYLGEDGWHRIADYRAGKVAQYHPATGVIELVEPTQYVKHPCAEMIRFKTTRGVDQLLSPEHRVLLANGAVMPAEDVEDLYSATHRWGRVRGSKKQLRFRTTFATQSTGGLLLSDAELRVQVAVNADGHQRLDGRLVGAGRMVVVRIKKQRKKERLRKLLAAANIPFKEMKALPVGFSRFSFAAPIMKGFGPQWWYATQHQLEVVASELVNWDGSRRSGGGEAFTTTIKEEADFAQYAYSAAGKRASLRVTPRLEKGNTEYTVYAKAGDPTAGLYGVNGGKKANNVWREPSPDGFKYCFMVPSTFLLLRRNGCIFATGNTGKTRSALWAWDWLKCQGLSQKLLIVCTRSIMRSAWQAEVFRTIRHRKVAVLYGRKTSNRQERLAQLASDADIYIINHDGVKTIYKELMERTDIDAIVLDELATYRNGGTGRSKDMAKLARTKKFVWGLTGSPMPQAPTDVWAQGRIVTPQSTPKYFSHLRDQMMERVAPNIYKPKAGAVGIAYQIMQPSVRFTLGDVVELPDITYRDVAIDMSPEQSRVYNEIVRHCKTLVQEKQITAFNAAIAMGKLVQIAGGWVYSQDKAVATLDAAPRMAALIDAVNSTSRKVIVFAPYISTLGGISEALKTEKIPHEVIHGKTKDRDRIFYEFQHENKFKVLVAHPRTMAHGLTLTEADTIIWFLPIMSYEIYEQANARIRRVGQKHKQQVIHFVASPVERRIYSLLRGKQTMQDKFLSLLEEGTLSNGTTSY